MRDATEPSDIAAQLARMPEVIARLLAEHVPDEHGRCHGCGRPGTGTPYLLAPCDLWTVADAARRLRAASPGVLALEQMAPLPRLGHGATRPNCRVHPPSRTGWPHG
jgi:hypothetical protein